MDQRVTADCVANARALAPALAAAAARIEADRQLPPDIVDALHEARLFRMLVPRSYGGDEVSPVAFMQAVARSWPRPMPRRRGAWRRRRYVPRFLRR